ncbi:MAG: HEAT repeat domain-containing protein [bacterium]
MASGLSPEDKADLLRDLKSGEPKRRDYAVRTLAKKVDAHDVESFMRKLRPYEWEGRLGAVSLLERIGDEDSADKIRSLALDFHPRVRSAARKALKKLGVDKIYSNDEVLELVSYLEHPSWWVKVKAIKALAHIKDPRATEAITHMLLDEDEQVREAAEEALSILQKVPR